MQYIMAYCTERGILNKEVLKSELLIVNFLIFNCYSRLFHFNIETTLREKVSVFGVFLVRIFPYSDYSRITPYLSVFNPNAGNYKPEKLRIQTLFMKCQSFDLRIKA